MRSDEELPSFYANIDRARRALADDGVMHALAPGDRAMLRRAFDHLRQEVEDGDLLRRPLHGEAHSGNLLVTPEGLRWIDFEDACVGPLEWDLAFLPERAVDVFPEADLDLLALLRRLNDAVVATWCFVRWEFKEMRWHAQFHLERVRRAEEA